MKCTPVIMSVLSISWASMPMITDGIGYLQEVDRNNLFTHHSAGKKLNLKPHSIWLGSLHG